jgi:hypothetical protein
VCTGCLSDVRREVGKTGRTGRVEITRKENGGRGLCLRVRQTRAIRSREKGEGERLSRVSVWRREHTRLNKVSFGFLVLRCGCRVTKGTKQCFPVYPVIVFAVRCVAVTLFSFRQALLWKAVFLSCRLHVTITTAQLPPRTYPNAPTSTKESCRAHTWKRRFGSARA